MKTRSFLWQDSASIATLAEILRANCLVVGTSDTVLGFLANVTPEGFQSLNAVKKRTDKPYLLLIGSVEKVSLFSDDISVAAQILMERCWPGPLTIILKAKNALPDYMQSADGTIALRVPLHEGLLKLLAKFDALFSTSANLTGNPVPATLEQLDPAIVTAVAAMVIDDFQSKDHTQPSTIVDCTGPQIRIVREGAYSVAQIYDITRDV